MRFIALFATLVAEAIVLRPAPFQLTDHFIFVTAGRLVLEGRSPYDPAAWADAAQRFDSPHIATMIATTGAVWSYPPWTAYLFAPFGALPPVAAAWAFHLSDLAVGIVGLALLARSFPWRHERTAALALALGAAFQPFVIGVRWGQFGGLLILGLALLIHGLGSSGRARVPALVTGALLLAAKPHVVTVLGVVVLAILISRRAWRDLVAIAAPLAVIGGVTTALYPEWTDIAGFGYRTRVEEFARYASTYSLAFDLSANAWPVVAGILIVLASGACAVAWLLAPSDFRLHAGLAGAATVSLTIVPYLYPYDHVTLLPALFLAVAVAQHASTGRVLQLGAAFAIGLLVPWAAFFVSSARPTQATSAWVPLLMSGLILASVILARTNRRPSLGEEAAQAAASATPRSA